MALPVGLLEAKVEAIRVAVKRRREEMFDGSEDDDWATYFEHVYKNLEEVCAANCFLKEQLQVQLASMNRDAQKSPKGTPRGFPTCKEIRDVVDDGGRVVLASRK